MSNESVSLEEARNLIPAYVNFDLEILNVALKYHNLNPQEKVTLVQWENSFETALATISILQAYPGLIPLYTFNRLAAAQPHAFFPSAADNNSAGPLCEGTTRAYRPER